jgi:hypothetical protein
MVIERHVTPEHPLVSFEGLRVSWGGVWAGTLVVLGTMLVLSALGIAIGFSVEGNVNPGSIGAGAVIWSRVSLLIALFLGGMAAARMSMVWDRFTGLAQGVLVWVVSMVAVLLFGANGVGLIGVALAYGTAAQRGASPGATAWITFVAIVLSLMAALLGSAIGQRRAAARARSEIAEIEEIEVVEEEIESDETTR